MAGAAAAGVAFLAWGISKLMSSSSEETKSPEPLALRSDYYREPIDTGRRFDQFIGGGSGAAPPPAYPSYQYPRSITITPGWEKPPPGSYKLNFDGCDRHQLDLAGAGCIIRDSNGSLVVAAAYKLSRENISVAEAEALRKGLQLAKQYWKIKNLSIEGDSMEVIDRVLGHMDTKRSESGIYPIIADIKKEMQRPCFRIKHIRSEHNTVANELANIGARLGPEDQDQKTWACAFNLPSKVAKLIEKDRNGY
ncbi:hypothetical protein Nepgr_003646 [Nepenthes gracilis]|uniref:RNase H type-1 domain-containing protein n=1 Tax=Nepenthes gracilis TaxID=150966 RepID=A0AAD3RZZ0_NEPGR|nr:hypothetical protein Nepgr_003646 [Nepenthes gracilis]